MSAPGNSAHADPGLLQRVATGARPGAALAEHLALCPGCRRDLARRDPSALFGLLSDLPWTRPVPEYPGIAALEPAAPKPPARSLPRAAFVAAAAAAAALVTVVSLLGLKATPPPVVAERAPVATMDRPLWPPVVAQVDSPTARVVTLVPPGGDRPSVTLILDEEEFDL